MVPIFFFFFFFYLFFCNFRNAVSRKTTFPKKLHVRKPHESSSRIRVGEGSPKEKEIKKDKILKNKR